MHAVPIYAGVEKGGAERILTTAKNAWSSLDILIPWDKVRMSLAQEGRPSMSAQREKTAKRCERKQPHVTSAQYSSQRDVKGLDTEGEAVSFSVRDVLSLKLIRDVVSLDH